MIGAHLVRTIGERTSSTIKTNNDRSDTTSSAREALPFYAVGFYHPLAALSARRSRRSPLSPLTALAARRGFEQGARRSLLTPEPGDRTYTRRCAAVVHRHLRSARSAPVSHPAPAPTSQAAHPTQPCCAAHQDLPQPPCLLQRAYPARQHGSTAA